MEPLLDDQEGLESGIVDSLEFNTRILRLQLLRAGGLFAGNEVTFDWRFLRILTPDCPYFALQLLSSAKSDKCRCLS